MSKRCVTHPSNGSMRGECMNHCSSLIVEEKSWRLKDKGIWMKSSLDGHFSEGSESDRFLGVEPSENSAVDIRFRTAGKTTQLQRTTLLFQINSLITLVHQKL
ncbi:hypothetical protein EON65_16375 [archaeon]|nr:MAG: hypothetical protein EON65_16375 [archaeon]